MSDYPLTFKTRRIIKLKNKIDLADVTTATQQQIDEYNRSDIKADHAFKVLYKPVKKDILRRTFIIPVNDGAITGYLFEKYKDRAVSGQSSLIIFFHEGGWMLGNLSKCAAFCSNLCNVTGASVLAVDFRLAPKFKFPIPVEDCYQAFLWAYQGARYWRIDPDKIYLMGTITGGNLAAAVSRLARDRKGPKIAGQILVSPVTDGRMRTESYEKFKDGPFFTSKEMSFFIQNYSREPKDILDPLFSPLLARDNSRLPQTLIFASEFDPLYDDARLYSEVLNKAETPSKFLVMKGMFNGFLKYPSAPDWLDVMLAIASFVGGRAVKDVEIMTNEERRKLSRRPQLIVQ